MTDETREQIRSVLIYNSNGVTNYDPIINEIDRIYRAGQILAPKQGEEDEDLYELINDYEHWTTSDLDEVICTSDAVDMCKKYSAQLRTDLAAARNEIERLKSGNETPLQLANRSGFPPPGHI